jgi:hypothetical protein
MSGVEAAGFVLGILPLLISAAEHFDDVFKPFKRYRKFAPELESYQQQLGTQKTIFRNECQWLLATLIGRQAARDMLKERTHPSWTDPDLDEKFSRQLGESGAACKTTIDLVESRLKVIEEETASFGLVIQQSIPVSLILSHGFNQSDHASNWPLSFLTEVLGGLSRRQSMAIKNRKEAQVQFLGATIGEKSGRAEKSES